LRCLIVEDDFISRRIMKELLSPHFDCDIAVDGDEAIKSFKLSMDSKNPYNLICLDIMMPKIDGREALKQIRLMEKELQVPPNMEVKVIMTTALDDPKTVFETYYQGGATSYLVKPISKVKLMRELRTLGLILS
jgi:two-component system, chemotaxis family, chemotaxis protein CheY